MKVDAMWKSVRPAGPSGVLGSRSGWAGGSLSGTPDRAARGCVQRTLWCCQRTSSPGAPETRIRAAAPPTRRDLTGWRSSPGRGEAEGSALLVSAAGSQRTCPTRSVRVGRRTRSRGSGAAGQSGLDPASVGTLDRSKVRPMAGQAARIVNRSPVRSPSPAVRRPSGAPPAVRTVGGQADQPHGVLPLSKQDQ